MKFISLLVTISFVLISLSSVQADQTSLYYLDHPLVGKVYSANDQQWVSEKQLSEEIKRKQFILIGETHTNPEHHAGQARLLEQWLTNSKPTASVFEMLSYQHQFDFQQQALSVDDLMTKLDEIDSRWKWPLYQPLLQMHVEHQLPIIGGNLTKQQLSQYSSKRLSDSDDCKVERDGLAIDICTLLNEQQQKTIEQLIFDAHCGYLPMEHTPTLKQAQLAKDASFSIAMAKNAGEYQLALIAGSVHVRKDIGVPVHLQELIPAVHDALLSIAFFNVQPEKTQIGDYFPQTEVSQQYDYVIFTPSERNQDPCEEFAEQLKNMKKSKH